MQLYAGIHLHASNNKALGQEGLTETNADFVNRRRDCRELKDLERMPNQYEEELKKLN
jgi:hypothetical protein